MKKIEWLNQKLVEFPFDNFLKGGNISLKRIESFNEANFCRLYFIDLFNSGKIELEIFFVKNEIHLTHEYNLGSSICRMIKGPLHAYLLKQEDCPLNYFLFGKVTIDLAY